MFTCHVCDHEGDESSPYCPKCADSLSGDVPDNESASLFVSLLLKKKLFEPVCDEDYDGPVEAIEAVLDQHAELQAICRNEFRLTERWVRFIDEAQSKISTLFQQVRGVEEVILRVEPLEELFSRIADRLKLSPQEWQSAIQGDNRKNASKMEAIKILNDVYLSTMTLANIRVELVMGLLEIYSLHLILETIKEAFMKAAKHAVGKSSTWDDAATTSGDILLDAIMKGTPALEVAKLLPLAFRVVVIIRRYVGRAEERDRRYREPYSLIRSREFVARYIDWWQSSGEKTWTSTIQELEQRTKQSCEKLKCTWNQTGEAVLRIEKFDWASLSQSKELRYHP